MTITLYTGAVPNRSMSQTAFNSAVAEILAYFVSIGSEINTTAAEIIALTTVAAYSGGATYDIPDTVYGTDGMTYRCTGTSVTGDDPVGSVTGDWVKLTLETEDVQLYPLASGAVLTGGMIGLGYARTGANQVTVQPGNCFDSTNSEMLSLASAQAVTIPAGSGLFYNLFLCDDGVVRQDTHIDGDTLLSAYARRWIGYVKNYSTSLCYWHMSGNRIIYTKSTEQTLASLAAAYGTIDHSAFLPITRIEGIKYGVVGTTATAGLGFASADGTNQAYIAGINTDNDETDATGSRSWDGYPTGGSDPLVPFKSDMQFKYLTAAANLLVHQVTLRR